MTAAIEGPPSQCKVAGEVEEKGELQPPGRVTLVHLLLSCLDESEIEREREREQQNPWIDPEEEKDEHAHLGSDTAAASARWTCRVARGTIALS